MSSAESGPYKYWRGIWGKGAKDVYAVGEANATGSPGAIWHYDGTSWTADSSFTATTGSLRGIWGTTGLTVAVGAGGSIVANTGSGWSTMTSPTTQDLADVWGSGSKDVFAAGASGTVLHYDGTSWSAMHSGTTANLGGVWGASAKDVYAVGDGGTILHHCLP